MSPGLTLLKVNRPSMSVAPRALPFLSLIVAPMIASPCASTTTPFTALLCDVIVIDDKAIAITTKYFENLIFLVLGYS